MRAICYIIVENMANNYQALYETVLYGSISSTESSPRSHGVSKLQQKPNTLVSWYGTGIADQSSSRCINRSGSNAARHRLRDKPHNPNRRTISSSAELSTGLDDGQDDAFKTTRYPLQQSPRAQIDLSAVSRIKTEQALKRREQNRQAQRAYRERKMKYSSELELQIEEMDRCMQLLQFENRDLLQRLCKLRATNNILRNSQTEAEASNDESALSGPAETETPRDSTTSSDSTQSMTPTGAEACIPVSKEGLASLYEAYMAIWTLLSSHLPLESQPEDYAVVLAYLQAMAVRRMGKSEQSEVTSQD